MTMTNEERSGEDAYEQDEAAFAPADEMTATPPEGTVALSLEEQLAAAQAEAARNLDGWQRTQAEFANARKRFEKQRAEIYASANAEIAAKLLPIVDDFERALETAPDDSQQDAWHNGIVLVHRKVMAMLDEMGVQPIPAVGEPFDPNVHEALMQEASADYDTGIVVREMRRGYRLGDRVVRPSLVVVSE